MAKRVTPWTLSEARELLNLWKAAYKMLASGQVKEYAIGARKLTMIDADEIQRQIDYFAREVKALEEGTNTMTSRQVVFRD